MIRIEEKYYAHIAADGRKQSVEEHLTGAAELAAEFASKFNAEDHGYYAGILHDLGKYSKEFKKRIENNGPKVDHSTAGALESYKNRNYSEMFCIAGHHSGLPNGGARGVSEDGSLLSRLEKAKKPISSLPKVDDIWKTEISVPALKPRVFKDNLDADFFIRMIYSCLVDADFIDTDNFMSGEIKNRGVKTDAEKLNKALDYYIKQNFKSSGPLNHKRNEILQTCINAGAKSEPGIFTLTVPTGGGKTVSSLAFALRHLQRNNMDRIIYVVPYTTIIEQNAEKFREILGKENVLEHHSGVLFDIETEADDDSLIKARAVENWDFPVVVTTSVRFFESLYGNRSSKCRRIHNIANSIVIFDEAQMIPAPYLKPCINAISQLVRNYNTTAILCTATQPALERYFKEFDMSMEMEEICPQKLSEDDIFKRVNFKMIGSKSWTEISNLANDNNQALIVVNSRKNARTLYDLICSNSEIGSVYHLSTLVYPEHRRRIISEIKRKLAGGEPCKVVSTSLIEAGVDIDFPVVYREIAGLDSIIQAGGRCNREGRHSLNKSFVYIFEPEEDIPPAFEIPAAAGRNAIELYSQDIACADSIRTYFEELFYLKGDKSLDQKGILEIIKKNNFPFKDIAEKFHLIENNMRSIYIPEGDGKILIERLLGGEKNRTLYRELGLYAVSVYDTHFRHLYDSGLIQILEDGSAYLTDVNVYDKATGLSMESQHDSALFI